MRVLITDFLAESDFEREVLPGVEVDALLSLIGHPPTPADLVRVVGERPAAVLITWYEMFFDATTLAALSRAGVVGIVRAGVGFDNIDLVGARTAGITVCNVPDYGTDEVADHAMALLLWCLRCLRAAPPAAAPPTAWWDAATLMVLTLPTRCPAHRSSSNCMVGCGPLCLYPAIAGMHLGSARLWSYWTGDCPASAKLRPQRALVRSLRGAWTGEGHTNNPRGEPARSPARLRCSQHPLLTQP